MSESKTKSSSASVVFDSDRLDGIMSKMSSNSRSGNPFQMMDDSRLFPGIDPPRRRGRRKRKEPETDSEDGDETSVRRGRRARRRSNRDRSFDDDGYYDF